MRSSTSSVRSSTKRAWPRTLSASGMASTPSSDEADEAVALALDARHHGLAVDVDRAVAARGRTPAKRSTACAASAAAISSLLGMQPTRAQVVPYGPPSISSARLPAGLRGAVRGESGRARADDRHVGVSRASHGLSNSASDTFGVQRRPLSGCPKPHHGRRRRPTLTRPCAASARGPPSRRSAGR